MLLGFHSAFILDTLREQLVSVNVGESDLQLWEAELHMHTHVTLCK
jgi:hypothetical protein